MKKIKDLPGSVSKVELVEIDGHKYVLRTAHEAEIINEREFQKVLHENQLPSLKIFDYTEVKNNQLLLEYINDSPTLEKYIACQLDPQIENSILVQWGKELARIHAIIYDDIFSLDENGKQMYQWQDVIDHEIEYGQSRQKNREGGAEKVLVERVIQNILKLKEYQPNNFSLIHCDPHENNVLLRDDELVFFDKGSEFFSGDPLFDTAVIAMSFIGGVKGLEDFGSECDKKNLEAFIEGYGNDFRKHPFFTEFLLMRCLTRHPNPFTPYLGKVMSRLT